MILDSPQPIRELLNGLRLNDLSAEALVSFVCERFDLSTLSAPDIEQLRREACDMVWRDPRLGWAYARVACQVADKDDQLSAKCRMTLGIALNALGKFFEAPPLLEEAAEMFEAHQQWRRWIRCQCELTIAYVYRSEFDKAKAALARAYTRLAEYSDPHTRAHYHRAEGLLHYEQNRAKDAVESLRRAADLFIEAGEPGEAAVTWCYLTEAQRFLDPQDAMTWVQKARALVKDSDPLHQARCDYYEALVYQELNEYANSLDLYSRAQAIFVQEGMDYQVAMCDLQQGITFYWLDRYREALRAHRLARDSFELQGLYSHVARCDINTALVYYSTNRYLEALAIYQRVVDAALTEGRTLRAARCYTNMGLCYDHLGRYDRALALHHLALQAFVEADNWTHVAICQQNLVKIYRHLGRFDVALQHCIQAQETLLRLRMHMLAARCHRYMADIHCTLRQYKSSLESFLNAQRIYEELGNEIQAATCRREMAFVYAQLGGFAAALDLLAGAKRIFLGYGLLAEAALCDLIEGEVYLQQGQQMLQAAEHFEAALSVLHTGFPEEAWRAQYGLGRYARSINDSEGALKHWLSAIGLTNQSRLTLPTERLSGGFFADRRQLYEDALALTLELECDEQALVVAEAGKAQTFVNWSQDYGWRNNLQDDPQLALLLDQEDGLRRQIAQARGKLRWTQRDEPEPITRSVNNISEQVEILEELAQLSKQYEDLIEQLRIVAHSKFDMQSPSLFSLSNTRQQLNERLGFRWACVTYYMLQDRLIIFYIDPQQLIVREKALSRFDHQALEQCTNPLSEFRDMVYAGPRNRHNGTHSSGRSLLGHLYELLIPSEVAELGTDDLLIIAPHAKLHRLPFQALLNDDVPLIQHIPLVVVPSLGALHSLLVRSDGQGDITHALAIGLSEFGERARALHYSQKEIKALKEVFGARIHLLWQKQATRAALHQMNDSKELSQFDLIHFTTHARQDYAAPSQSHILLHDDDLSYAHIINLRLNARLVVLGSCNGVIGASYSGDEVMGLAQAFFFAGTQTVIASLWAVEDESTSEFMTRFYSHLQRSENVARACWLAQREMADAGFTPYQWAPFIVIGLP